MTPVLFDAWCGEPIAWFRHGDPVIGHITTPTADGWDTTVWTRALTVPEAIESYGAVTELVVGILNGFESVKFGETKFVSKAVRLDPRPMFMDGVVATVDDPVTEHFACPKCGVAKGEHCKDTKTRHRARTELASREWA